MMSTIRPLQNATCPRCGDILRYRSATRRSECALCGYSVEGKALPEDDRDEVRAPARPSMNLSFARRELDSWARSSFETAQAAYTRGDNAEAVAALHRALHSEPEFVEAHLWIGLLSDDPDEKRDHLGEVIALDPGNPDALRELMVLNGRLSREQAAQTYHHDDQRVEEVVGAVDATLTTLKCPVCGGDLTVDDANGRVSCRFCGHSAALDTAGGNGAESLNMALLERKAQKTRWHIGKRLLHCNGCGAERTIPAGKLSARCPFCGLNHVVVQDALASFEQPDSLVPFVITEDDARTRIAEQANSLGERFLRLFEDNRIASIRLDGVFLPFWVYDALLKVTETRIDRRSQGGRYGVSRPRQGYTTTSYTDGCHNLAVCGVSNPPPHLTRRLGDYAFDRAVPYAPKLLAKHPAALYDMDFDKASLEARSLASTRMKEKHGQQESGDVQVNITALVQTMEYRLLLLPVWVATLTERDGDTRTALVNGQTGAVVLGQVKKG
jgi:uncharacterized Zn finger protein (UPF0148 family)